MTSMNFEKDFLKELSLVRSNPERITDFQDWVLAHKESILERVAPGVYLKLLRGGVEKVMGVVATYLPDCSRCNEICQSGVFASRCEHSKCATHVDHAVANGDLLPVMRPSWLGVDKTQLGADGYFLCTSCSAMWTLIEPERQDSGMWARIA